MKDFPDLSRTRDAIAVYDEAEARPFSRCGTLFRAENG